MSRLSAAFVDIGVHQDGLVHISAMSKTFIKDPRDAAKPGDVVKVKVLEVDAPRKRIALTMRLDDSFEARPAAFGSPQFATEDDRAQRAAPLDLGQRLRRRLRQSRDAPGAHSPKAPRK